MKATTAADYGRWHTLSFVWTVGTGVQYFLDGEPLHAIAETDTAKLANVILNVYNFGQDYDVYWDNFKVGSTGPATYEPVVTGQMTISASDVEVTGLYLTNPGQTNAVVIANTAGNVTIANNRIQGVGSTSLNSNVHAIIMSNGADQVTIANNAFSNLRALGKSLSAIGVLDSAATNSSEGLVVRANTFADIASDTKGAYGVIINNKIGAPGAQITDNTFSGLNGGWTHAIGLEGPTPNAVVSDNTFSNLSATVADKSAVFFEKNPGGATVMVSGNRFNGGGYYGVAIHPNDLPGGSNGYNYAVTAKNNWWGSACGPGPVGPGSGAGVSTNVDYSPWWTDASGGGTASEGAGGSLVIPAGATTAQQQAIMNCAAGKTVTYAGNPNAGGVVINTPGVTINLNGATFGPGSPYLTVNAANTTVNGPGTLDGWTGSANSASPAILVNAGGDNFILNGVEVKRWADGVR